jgi:hypothetical protein
MLLADIMTRSLQINFRVSPTEHEQLRVVANHYGRRADAEVVRFLVRQAYLAILGGTALGEDPVDYACRIWKITPAELQTLQGAGAVADPVTRQAVDEWHEGFVAPRTILDRLANRGTQKT